MNNNRFLINARKVLTIGLAFLSMPLAYVANQQSSQIDIYKKQIAIGHIGKK
jgi:hypothetical protein